MALKTRNNETKRNVLAVSFHSVLLAVSFYLLLRVELYIFVSFRFGGFAVWLFRVLVHVPLDKMMIKPEL